MKLAAAATFVAALLTAPSARALCIYNGEDNAKTTLAQEFEDSTWVVRAKVLAARDHFSDEEDSWTLYGVEVLQSFKGRPPKMLPVFTFRDSGGFYMDRPWVPLHNGTMLVASTCYF